MPFNETPARACLKDTGGLFEGLGQEPLQVSTDMVDSRTLPKPPWPPPVADLGLYSLSGKTSYRKISWSLEAARFWFKLFQSLWNLVGTSAALLPRCLSNFRAIRPLQHPISRLRDFTRFGGRTSYRLVNRGPEHDRRFRHVTASRNCHLETAWSC